MSSDNARGGKVGRKVNQVTRGTREVLEIGHQAARAIIDHVPVRIETNRSRDSSHVLLSRLQSCKHLACGDFTFADDDHIATTPQGGLGKDCGMHASPYEKHV